IFRCSLDPSGPSEDLGTEGDAAGAQSLRSATISIAPVAQVLAGLLSRMDGNDELATTDTTLPPLPVQERLGVFPSNDPACR
ncbi:MAG: hypothetical protein ACO3D8_05605, partial [Ilumatobacteraceae bacterium]